MQGWRVWGRCRRVWGKGWQPLSSAHDYGAVHQRVLSEIFTDEARRAGLEVAKSAPAASPAGAVRRQHAD